MTDLFSLDAYDYDLPPELIAAHPVSPRDAARLLVCGTRNYRHKHFYDLADYLEAGDVLVLNSSKVIPARLHGLRPARDGMGMPVKIEILLHRPQGDFSTWAVFAKPAKRLKSGDILFFGDVTAKVLGREDDQVILRFNLDPSEMESFFEKQGEMPLPPYLQRAAESADKIEYQTVYAETAGSVAAPTAGLHFTPELLRRIREKGVHVANVTLHVGAGTFLPVNVDDIRQHKMHSEWGSVSEKTAALIRNAKANGRKVMAVGTTSARLLESAARVTGEIQAWEGETDIFITPGFHFNVVDILVTNFHLPRSTLFMLVSAFLGGVDRAQELYRIAIENRYRFYSYGDACLLTRP